MKSKRLISIAVIASLLLALMAPFTTYAADFRYTGEAAVLHEMNLYAGISTDEFVPDLYSAVLREQGITMAVRAFSREAYALSLDEESVASALSVFSDADGISGWARPYVAAGVLTGLVNGYPDGTFGADRVMDGKMLSKLLLVGAGYEVTTSSYNYCPYLLRDYGSLNLEQAAYYRAKRAISRDDMVGLVYYSLSMKFNGTWTTIVGRLVDDGVVNEEVALASGCYNNEIIYKATAAVAAYEAAPYATPAQVAAGGLLKKAAEAMIAKFNAFPNAASTTILSIRNSLLTRIAVQAAKVGSMAGSGTGQ